MTAEIDSRSTVRSVAAGPVQAFDEAGSERLIDEGEQACGQVQCAPREFPES